MITIREHLAWQLAQGDSEAYRRLVSLLIRLRTVKGVKKQELCSFESSPF